MPIRWRLTLLFVAVTAVVGAGGGAVYLHNLRAGADAAADATLRVRADPVVQALRDGSVEIQSGSPSLIAPTDALIQVLDPQHRVSDSTPSAGNQPLLVADALPQTRPVTVTRSLGGELGTVRLLAVPVPSAGGVWVVIAGSSLDATNASVDRARDELLLAAAPALALAAAGAWMLARAALRPVERMRRQAAEISANDAGARLAVPGTRDEIADLAVTINELLGRLQGTLTRQRGFIADAGHELRTPLAILRAELELAHHPSRTRNQLFAAVDSATEETIRLGRLAEDLLTLAKGDGNTLSLRPGVVSVADLLDEERTAAAAKAHDKQITITVVVPDGLTVYADRDRLRQALDNLVANALTHTGEATEIELRARPAPDDTVELEVHDSGPGFPPEFLAHAFERFRRADGSRTRDSGGSGLGLAIVAAIAEAHRGTAFARNDPTRGAVVGIRVPARQM
ncbi:MAG: two-component system, OmpR family, sensor kinase [Acidimicrobiaceae bacterium]|jgi:signal transduction histidine kinase